MFHGISQGGVSLNKTNMQFEVIFKMELSKIIISEEVIE